MHSGLQYVTPSQKRNGEHHTIFALRNEIITDAKQKHPERWGIRKTRVYQIHATEVLNPAREEVA